VDAGDRGHGSGPPFEHEVGQRADRLRRRPERLQVALRLRDERPGFLLGRFEAVVRGIRRLFLRTSLPAVLPSSARLPSTSRISSTIWNASPSASPARPIAASCSVRPPASVAPAVSDTRISAAVLWR